MLSKLVIPSFGPPHPPRHSRFPSSFSLTSSKSHMTPFSPHGCTGSTIRPTTYSATKISQHSYLLHKSHTMINDYGDRIACRQPAGTCCGHGRTLRVHSPDGSTFLHEMTSWPPSEKCDLKSKNPTPSIDAYFLEEQSCQISPNPI